MSVLAKRKKEKTVSKQKIIPKVKIPSLRRETKLRSVKEAELTAKQLETDFLNTKSRTKRLRIKRKLILAANRAEKKSKKRGISKAKKKEFEDIAKVYSSAHERMVLEDIWETIERPAIPE